MPQDMKDLTGVFETIPSSIKLEMLKKYKEAIGNAKNRKTGAVPWELTFEEWAAVWWDSGHWFDRGPKKHQFCMGRFGDEGPYKLGNIKIITMDENRIEQNSNKPKRELASKKMSVTKKNTPELIERVSKLQKERMADPKRKAEVSERTKKNNATPKMKKIHSEQAKRMCELNSKPLKVTVLETGEQMVFSKARLAAESLGLKVSTVQNRLVRSKVGDFKPLKGFTFRYI